METLVVAGIGTAASTLSTVSLLPQVLRTWRSGSARDLSAAWLVAALLSMTLWVIYGVLVDARAVVCANALTAVQAAFILAVKLRPAAQPLRDGRLDTPSGR